MAGRDGDIFERIIGRAAELSATMSGSGLDADESADVDAMLDTVRRWASQSVDADAIDAESHIPTHVLESAAELGLFGVSVPAMYGGSGLSLRGIGAVIAELATVERSVATTLGLHNGLGTWLLARQGPDALKKRLLPELASGRRVAAFSVTEPAAGSHVAAAETVLREGPGDPEGPLRLNGQKCYVTNGGFADVFTVYASSPGLGGGRRGFTWVVVERDAPGLVVGPPERKLGLRGSSTTTLHFDDVPVPRGNILGEPGRALASFQSTLAVGRTLMAAGCVGTARAASHLGFEHAKSRTQFGRAIAYLPLVREKIARMAGTLYTIESVVALTTALAGPSSDGDISVASSVAKVMASEGAWAIADEALQIHGGAGYLEPVGVARLLRDSRITRIFEGTSEVLRLHLGLEMVIGAAPGALRLADFAHPRLADFAGRLDTLLDRTRRAAGEVRGRPGPRLSRRQLELAGVADATMACFAMIASLLRATATLRAAPEGAEAASALSTLRWIEETMACRVEDGLARAAGETGEDLIDALTDTVIAEG